METTATFGGQTAASGRCRSREPPPPLRAVLRIRFLPLPTWRGAVRPHTAPGPGSALPLLRGCIIFSMSLWASLLKTVTLFVFKK